MTKVEQLETVFFNVEKEFSMNAFAEKLKVQKIIYLLQEYGVNLGYSYEWYIRGPYCKQVSVDAHSILDDGIIRPPEQTSIDLNQIQQFNQKLGSHLDDATWLEIAASIVYLKNEYYSKNSLDEVIGSLIEDLTCGYKKFNDFLVHQVIKELHNLKIFN